MSTHPNVVLLLVLTPDGLSRKTLSDIKEQFGTKSGDIKIGDIEYRATVMESNYDAKWQISASEGNIIIFDLVTYGYGSVVSWKKLEAQKLELEEWAKKICDQYHCSFRIDITANYW